MMGQSVLKYFKNLFAGIAAGRTDYERSAMLPNGTQEYVAHDYLSLQRSLLIIKKVEKAEVS